jgi:septal ring factor EnvC (AmiA/AmiB activator)
MTPARSPLEDAAPTALRPLLRRALPAGLFLLCASVAAGQAGYAALGDGLGNVESQLGSEQQRLEQARGREQELQAQLAALGPERERSEQRLRQNARTLYRVSRGGMLPMAGGISALLGHASRVSRLERLVQRDLRARVSFGARAQVLRAELSKLAGQVQDSEQKLSALQAARVEALHERSVHHSFESAIGAAPAQRLPSHAQYGLSVVSGAPLAERFTEQRGNLALPVSGPSSIQDATRAESDGPGLEFSGTPGAAVRAAAAGRVAFAETYGSYGKLVILEHGERYYSAYGGLARLDVQVGDDLSKSARLGSVGAQPIYFEVRRGTKTQDTRAWLGL